MWIIFLCLYLGHILLFTGLNLASIYSPRRRVDFSHRYHAYPHAGGFQPRAREGRVYGIASQSIAPKGATDCSLTSEENRRVD